MSVPDNASELYNEYLEIYFDQYMGLSDAKKKRNLVSKYDPTNLFLETYNYDIWFENEDSTDIKIKSNLPTILALEGCK